MKAPRTSRRSQRHHCSDPLWPLAPRLAVAQGCQWPKGKCGCRSGSGPQCAIFEILRDFGVGYCAWHGFDETMIGCAEFSFLEAFWFGQCDQARYWLIIFGNDDFGPSRRLFDQAGEMRFGFVKVHLLGHDLNFSCSTTSWSS